MSQIKFSIVIIGLQDKILAIEIKSYNKKTNKSCVIWVFLDQSHYNRSTRNCSIEAYNS